jgi:hypothetical protein
VDLVSGAIAHCRGNGIRMLLVDTTGLVGLPIPTLLDRFLMMEDWAEQAMGTVVVAMVARPEYIHARKFGVKVALEFGLVCDVCTSEADAVAWLDATARERDGQAPAATMASPRASVGPPSGHGDG